MVTRREELLVTLMSFGIAFIESILITIIPTGLLFIICYFLNLPAIVGKGLCFVALIFALARAIREAWSDLKEYYRLFGGPEEDLDEEVRRH